MLSASWGEEGRKQIPAKVAIYGHHFRKRKKSDRGSSIAPERNLFGKEVNTESCRSRPGWSPGEPFSNERRAPLERAPLKKVTPGMKEKSRTKREQAVPKKCPAAG